MLPTALALLTLATDPLAVLVTSKRAGAEQLAPKIAASVRKQFPNSLEEPAAIATLKAGGLDPKTCQGATECLQRAAKILGPKSIVIGVDVGKIAKTLAVHLEAISAIDGPPLAVTDVTLPADKWQAGLTEPLAAFVKEVTSKQSTQVADAPTQTPEISPAKTEPAPVATTSSEPTPTPTPTVTRAPPPSSSSPHLTPWISGGAAVLVFGGAAVLGVLGFQEKTTVDGSLSGDGISSLTQSDYSAHKARGNLEFTLALSTLILGAALAALTAVLFVKS